MKLLSSLIIALIASLSINAQTSINVDLAVISVIEIALDLDVEKIKSNKTESTNTLEEKNSSKSNEVEVCLNLDYLSDESITNEILVPETINDLEYTAEIASLQEIE